MIPMTARPVLSKPPKGSTSGATGALTSKKPLASLATIPAATPVIPPKDAPKFASLSGAEPITPARPSGVLELVPRMIGQPPGGASSAKVEQAVVTSSRTPIAEVSLPTADVLTPNSLAESVANLSQPSADDLKPNASITELVLVQQMDRTPGITGGGPSSGTALGLPPSGTFDTLATGGLVDANKLSFVDEKGALFEAEPVQKPFIDDATPLVAPKPAPSTGLVLLVAAVAVLALVL